MTNDRTGSAAAAAASGKSAAASLPFLVMRRMPAASRCAMTRKPLCLI